MPRIQPQKPTAMNSPILVLVTGTPTARAALASPPEAKIQLPTLVRSSTQDATATRAIQMNTVIVTSTPAIFTVEAKSTRAASKPSRSETEGVATAPPIMRVRPRLSPASMRNEARVTIKLGSFVLTRIHPLMNPMPRDTTSAKATPTQTLVLKYQENMDADRAEVMTATPVERSNSPPIISRATPTAMMPIVELPYRTVASELGCRKTGAMAEKNTKSTRAPTRAPISGRTSSFWRGFRALTRSSVAMGRTALAMIV